MERILKYLELSPQSEENESKLVELNTIEGASTTSTKSALTIADQNPLQIELILSYISKYLDYSNLKNGRLVCKQWNSVVFSTFEKKTIIRIEFKTISEFISTFSTSYDEGWIYKTIQFVYPEQLEDSSLTNWMIEYGKNIQLIKLGCEAPCHALPCHAIPCLVPKDYSLWNEFFTSLNKTPHRYAIKSETLQNLLLKWCPNLQVLRISFPSFKIEKYPNINNQEEEPASIGLKTLSLGTSYCPKKFPNVEIEVEKCALMILKMAPKVQTLILKSRKKESTGFFQIANFLSTQEGHSLATSLKKLDLHDFRAQPKVFETLAKCELKNVKFFRSGYLTSYWAEDAGNIELFLNSIAPHLEILHIGQSLLQHRRSYNVLTFPVMNSLTYLYIYADDWDTGAIDYVQQLPKLRTLIFRAAETTFAIETRFLNRLPNHGEGVEDEIQWEECRHKKLTTLRLHSWADSILIKKIVRYFPNLKFVHTRLDVFTFTQSFSLLSELKKLENLEIFLNGNSDEIDINGALICSLPQFFELKKFTLKLPEITQVKGIYQLNEDAVQNGFLSSPKLSLLNLINIKIFLDVYNILIGSGHKIQVKFTDCIIQFSN